ncbi:uncharacterized protein BP01DRAFT_124661 [Aspergillus saccharolyticus JOP 1030-1]|uniref:Uncharacterized protein n=1 Tax=Aspergillus saccharolyticus JOP 1030-1 TaxID=1450539 RepID=A0A318ZGN6_9EURO|nr:hypothetical protein BP01DRAFT_124661 [Aspergillus saccharolyticus JOP 1030-1]PYH42820.1 hypothetical protein BP01DRAFT_124661 [Aspergillus saccharolyticus JOP 1030-1]
MSTHQGPDPLRENKHEGFSKFVKRIRTAMRRSSMMKAAPTSGAQVATEAPAPIPITTLAATPQIPIIKAAPGATVLPNWGSIQEQKARGLLARYGLALEPGERKFPSDQTVQRVIRPIRMRVRRTCHRCQTTFGPSKVCVNCQHVRCTSCPPDPAVKPHSARAQTEAALQTIVSQKAPEATPTPRQLREPRLTLPSRASGQDLVYHPPRQRIRRTCHRCSTAFAADDVQCSTCQHIRCTLCPREPAKLNKYPYGYPGDAEPPAELPARTWKKPRQRVRYFCHRCNNAYQARETVCSHCGQEKGDETIREPKRKERPEPDPEIARRVEERLERVKIVSGS